MKVDFALHVEIERDTGRMLAVYFQIRSGKVASVEEFADGAAIANYSKDGYLLGVELLGPCKIQLLDKLAKHAPPGIREKAKRFLRSSVPVEMVLAS
jgi:hypothetical protein